MKHSLLINGVVVQLDDHDVGAFTAAEVADAINRHVSGVQASPAPGGGVSIGSKVEVRVTHRTIPRHVAAAAKRAGLPVEVGGAYGEVPVWLAAVLGTFGRMGSHPGRYRARLRLMAANQDVLRAAWRLGGTVAVREAYLALGRLRVA